MEVECVPRFYQKNQRRTRNSNARCCSNSVTYSTYASASSTSIKSTTTSTSSSLRRIAKNGKSILRPPAAPTTKTTTTTTPKQKQILKYAALLAAVFIVNLSCLGYVECLALSDSGNANTNGTAGLRYYANYNIAHAAGSSTSASASLALTTVANSDSSHRTFRSPDTPLLQIHGFRVESNDHEVEYSADGGPIVLGDSPFTIRIFGKGITVDTVITFTNEANDYQGSCLFPSTRTYKTLDVSSSGETAIYTVQLPAAKDLYYICAKQNPVTHMTHAEDATPLVHQGSEPWLRIYTYQKLLPLWASLLVILVCLCFSALFSGLNLGLMALDRTELKILRNTGSPKEREYARKIQPVRDQGNFLLCSILLGNVLVNSIFTIFLDSLTSGLMAVCFSTLAIVIFGEVTPQAICSRHGLAIGAKTIIITKIVMAITSPLSYPTSKILDYLLGEEIGNVYNRERLKELVKVTTDHNDLDKNEVNIISGALELRKKTVADVMTRIDDAFMLSLDAILDFETVSEIMKSGFSRIPVYEGAKTNIVTMLYIKDLAFVDTDDNTPLKTLCEFYQNPVHYVFEDYTLDVMFNQFKEGNIGHMAFVHRVNNEGDGDPFYETIGLITLEDVIEELIQAEIVDETDVFVDNRMKVRRNRFNKQDFTVFAERRENQHIQISPQLALATYQYLSTAVDAFKKDIISEPVLRRLLNQDVIHIIKCKGKEKDDPSLLIFQQGKAVDFFVLILEGRVEVTIGKEGLLFESGPFTYFGTQALVPNVVVESTSTAHLGSMHSVNLDAKIRQTFVPDYSVRVSSDVIYLAIPRSLYLTAKKATLLERTRKNDAETTSEAIDEEVERLLHSFNEDDKGQRSQSIRKASAAIGASNTASPSLNDISQQSRSIAAAPQHNSQQSNNTADIIDAISLSSQITSEPANDLSPQAEQNGDKEQHVAANTPLLPKTENVKVV